MITAQLYDFNIDAPEINRIMFDTKSRKLLELERMVLDASEFHFGGKCIILPVTAQMQRETGCSGTELEGIAEISDEDDAYSAAESLVLEVMKYSVFNGYGPMPERKYALISGREFHFKGMKGDKLEVRIL